MSLDEGTELNRFTHALRELCEKDVLREKWLLAPTLRVGFQWLDRVARSGRTVLNVRVKTLLHLGLELASPEMVARGTEYLRGAREEVLVERVFSQLQGRWSGYLGGLEPGPGLTRVLRASIRDLRIGGVTAGKLRREAFESGDKGLDVSLLLSAWEKELEKGGTLDYAALFRTALKRLKTDPDCIPPGTLVMLPADMKEELAGLEKAVWKSLPEASRVILPVDRPGEPAPGKTTDAAFLGWVREPSGAPAPAGDGTAEQFRAVGEANEVREVFRRCVARGIPLDQVEILYTQQETYVPLIYERAWNLGAEDHESIPVTFAEGLPPRYSRPGRALSGWLAWIREGFSQSVLLWLIRDGLLRMPEAGETGYGPARLAEVFRAVPVGEGRGRYLPALDRAIRAQDARAGRAGSGPAPADGGSEAGDGEPREGGRESLRKKLRALKAIRNLVADFLLWSPGEGSGPGQKVFLNQTALFLEQRVRRAGKFDEYCHEQLVKKIREMAECLGEEDLKGLDVPQWLADLPGSSHVGGLGPRPGCLYAAPLRLGGHSGRPYTFIVGLDDGRFPGGGLQDPLLLDAERRRISRDLPTAAGRTAERGRELAGLLARLRGRVTLSYSCRGLADDRDMFPSPLFLSAYRILSGSREAVLDDMLRDLSSPVSFAPGEADRCLDASEWWLWRTCSGRSLEDPEAEIAGHFPHLGRGLTARRARESDRFTEYDGHVPAAAAVADPSLPDGPILSPSRLEMFGQCPMDYFFRYVLRIEPPEEYQADAGVWLDRMQHGQLLHEVFQRFMSRLPPEDPLPRFDRDEGLLREVLEERIESWKASHPPPGPEVFQHQVRELRQTARIFLMEEEIFCRQSTPTYFEVSVGLPPEEDGTPLDTAEPVTVRLPGGMTVRVRGRIDRVDRMPSEKGEQFSIWDYKTGSSWKYTAKGGQKNPDPFNQGRVVQNILYLALAETRLREVVSPRAAVDRFGYFFPGLQTHGERIWWSARELAEGKKVVASLCRMLAAGSFPCSDNPGDIKYSDYLAAHNDPEEAAAAAERKARNPENTALEPFRELRGLGPEDEENP